jgi:hypothetical protein
VYSSGVFRLLSSKSKRASRAVASAASVRSVRFSPPPRIWLIRPGETPIRAASSARDRPHSRLINLDTTPARLHDALQEHPSTQNLRRYSDDDLPRLTRRLESDATNELDLFLATVYRLGYHKLLIYPFRPSVHRSPQASTLR